MNRLIFVSYTLSLLCLYCVCCVSTECTRIVHDTHSGREEKPLQFLDEQPSVSYAGKEYVGNEEAQVPSCIYVAILIISSCMYAHIQVLVIMCVCVCVCVCVYELCG
jgi:hypothetical protein